MADVDQPPVQPQQPVEVEDPEYELEQPIALKNKQEINRAMFSSLIKDNLSKFCKTFDGLGYSFVKLSLVNKALTGIYDGINKYPHLRQIELNNNLLTTLHGLSKLKYLISLNLSKNFIEDISILANEDLFPHLQTLNLSYNKIKMLGSVYLKKIKHLNLNYNEIEDITGFDGSKTLVILQLRGNKIKDVSTLSHLPKLRQLYLADNRLQEVTGLKLMDELVKLHLRKNKISKLSNLHGLPSLKYINIRENVINKIDQLQPIPQTVTILNILGNPLSEQLADNTKKQVWMLYRQFDKVNKQEITLEERGDFDKQYKDRLAQKQRQRLEKQQAQRQAGANKQPQPDAS